MRRSGVLTWLLLGACVVRPDPAPDAGAACSAAEVRCGTRCVNKSEDAANCGACGNHCGQGRVCSAGQCLSSCPAGKTGCEGGCVDLQINSRHCGSCGSSCPSNQACLAGACACPAGFSFCGGQCLDTSADPTRCGGCDTRCPVGEKCVTSSCTVTPPCALDQRQCGDAGICRDVLTDSAHCGACSSACSPDKVCVNGGCVCPAGAASCNGTCVSFLLDPRHCGGCGRGCAAGESCLAGVCGVSCQAGQTACAGQCVIPSTSRDHCGTCGHACTPTEICVGGACQSCNSLTTDCDGDGWTQTQGDCCDNPLGCPNPAQVNPGAAELLNNFVDDNCNGLVDTADLADVASCDTGLASDSSLGMDYARALGLCRTTVEVPATPQAKSWGVISAELLHADGTPLSTADAKSIRPRFGRILPREGSSMAVLASGQASDSTQTSPGPNGGPGSDPSEDLNHTTNILSCTSASCIKDWLITPNPPLKLANELPVAPNCGSGSTQAEDANDSVMVKLRIRAPTNARSFSLSSFFFSAEYPEFVCTNFNDQVLVLVDTPGGAASPSNPVDKNLLTYQSGNQSWPIGINLAGGTSLFRVCQSKTSSLSCWDPDVNAQSCAQGVPLLSGTGYEAPSGTGTCVNGGGTDWLITVGNVRPGEIVELRFVIWDVGDGILDSLVLFDNFQWDANPRTPGTSG